MNTGEEQVREIIACQAGEWVAAHRAGPLDAAERRAFYAWLTASPVHVEEYLGVRLLARHLPEAAADPDMPLELILDRVREDSEELARIGGAQSLGPAPRPRPKRRWLLAAVPAALALIGVAMLWWSGSPVS